MPLVNGDVTTIAGTVAGYLDGPAAASKFSFPVGVVRDSKGNIFIADFGIHCIRKISNGEVSTFAGSPTEGNTDGLGVAAQFSAPNYMTIGQNDNLYVSEFSNNRIRKITPTAEVTTVTGGDQGFANGTAASAQFHNPYEIKFDKSGNLIICDGNNSRIRMLSPEGIVTTLAGNGTTGLVNGVGTEAQFQLPLGVAINSKGEIFLSDRTQRVIRKIEFK